jgi:hypothetical protein
MASGLELLVVLVLLGKRRCPATEDQYFTPTGRRTSILCTQYVGEEEENRVTEEYSDVPGCSSA